LGSLDESYGRSFQDELSGMGRGQASVLSSSANASIDARVLRFKVATPDQLATTGGSYAFASRVESKQWRYDQGEESTRGFTLTGRGLVSAWEDAIVFPYGGTGARPTSDSRAFGWFSPELSTTGWQAAVVGISGLAPNTIKNPPLPDPWFPQQGWTSDLTGRGLVSAWEDAIVFPYGGTGARPSSDSRGFGWYSPELSTTGWQAAVVGISGLAPNTRTNPPLPDPWFPPKGWTSVLTGTDWIWSRTTNSGNPEGASLFRTTFSLGSADRVAIFYTASSRCRVWIDGVLVTPGWTSEPNEESFIYAHRATPYLSAGTHYIAVEAESRAWTPALPGVSRGILQVAVHSGGGAGAVYSSGNLLVGTSSSWKCLDYPTVYPAPTPGRILRQLLEEAQARGALTGWSLGCTDTADSAGQSWPNDQAHVFRVGQTYADVLRQMADTSIEFAARPAGLVLDVWRRDTITQPNAATFTIGTNLTELEEDQPR
jgi:hypothetical protein